MSACGVATSCTPNKFGSRFERYVSGNLNYRRESLRFISAYEISDLCKEGAVRGLRTQNHADGNLFPGLIEPRCARAFSTRGVNRARDCLTHDVHRRRLDHLSHALLVSCADRNLR